ncbi:hypothetical protein ACLBYE_28415, partial [Methylobacterium sp. A52T]
MTNLKNGNISQRARALIDAEWYRSHYLDSDFGAIDPVDHYMNIGWRNGSNPHPLFDASWYLRQLPDFPLGKIDPLIHFLTADHPLASPHPL